MKTSKLKSTLAFLFYFLFVPFLFAQKPIVWIGGTPGQTNDWNCPKNWNTHHVPDAFSDVLIPSVLSNSLASPVIHQGQVEINSLFIESNAALTVEKPASLVIYTTAEGTDDQRLKLHGTLLIKNELRQEQQSKAVPLAGKFR